MRYFIDTEFLEDGKTIDLLSIGIAAEDGREYYAQSIHANLSRANDWVARNVLPHLLHFDLGQRRRSCKDAFGEAVSRAVPHSAMCDDHGFPTKPPCPWRGRGDMAFDLRAFCDPKQHGQPEFWGYFSAYDWVAICQLFGDMGSLPDGWPMYCHDYRAYLDEHDRHHIRQPDDAAHYALSDARWLRESFAVTGIADALAVMAG